MWNARACAIWLGLLAVVCVVCADPISLTPVTQDGAASIAAGLVGPSQAAGMQFVEQKPRADFPPFTAVYRFDSPLPTLDPQGKPHRLRILVEASTGRVVGCDAGFGYAADKQRSKPKPTPTDLLSDAKAKEVAAQILGRARIPEMGMRLVRCCLEKPNDRYYSYNVLYSKWNSIEGTGDVELPTYAWMEIDAVTGEINRFLYKEWPVVIQVASPKVNKDYAVRAVVARYQTEAKNVVDAHLMVGFDYRGIGRDKADLQIRDPRRFYDEVQLKRQLLVWEVTLRRADAPGAPEITSLVDANTGDVFACEMPL